MRRILATALAFAVVAVVVRAEEPAKQAPKVVLQSPDGKKSYDLGKLVEEGPVLVRLTCACSGCDKELAQFQKLQEAYNAKGLKTLAVFREKPESTSDYAAKKDIKFLWLSDPKGDLWKTFDTKAMPTNILIDKGGRVADPPRQSDNWLHCRCLSYNSEVSDALHGNSVLHQGIQSGKAGPARAEAADAADTPFFTVLLLSAVMWVALFLAKQVTIPIQALAEGTREVSSGNFDYQVPEQAQDELGFWCARSTP